MSNKNNYQLPINKRVENFKKYYQRQNKRPLLGFFIESEYPLERYNFAKNLPTDRPLQPEDFELEAFLADCERLFKKHEACGGDFIWSASAFWGIPWVEAALGCEIYADHSTGSIHSKAPQNFTDPDWLQNFNPSNPWIRKMKSFLNAMEEKSAGRWPIGTTRMRGISDLLSALYGGQNTVFAMMEKPKEVHEVCKKITDFWIQLGKYQLDNIPLFHGGVGSFYYNMWAPAGTIWHQEDAAALLSPDLFNQFIRPYDERIVSFFSGCIMHQHPTGYLPYEAYLDMDMLALELHIDEGGPDVKELYPIHKKILKQKPLLIWGDLDEKTLDWIFAKLPHKGLAINTVVSNVDEAHYIWDKYISE